jgi:glyoxylase-like metal-dependent hydrolase (beta-lactamase superfamily II)
MKTYLAATATATAAAFAVLGAGAALAQAPAANRPPPPPMKIEKIKPDLYFITGGGGNSELRVTKDGAFLVDTKLMNDKDYGDLIKLIGEVSPKPVKIVVVTHHHADHTGNDEKFIASGAKVIGQENIPKIFEHYTSQLAPHTPAAPNVLYKDRKDVKLGGVDFKLYHFSAGHTGGDTIVYFPKDKAIALGDLLVEAPTVPNYDAGNGQGSILGFQKELGEALKLKWDVAFPGHGAKPMTREEVVEYKKKIDQLISRIRDSIRAGVPKDKLIASIKTDDLGWKLGGQFWAPAPRVDALVAELSPERTAAR